MKINLLINGYPLNGYLNIDPLTKQNDQTKIAHNIDNLDELVDNNECTEFLAHNVIDTFPLPARQQVLNHWMAKIEHGGTFTLSGLDINKAARLVVSGDINVGDLNKMLYGPCNHMWTINKGAWSMQDAVNCILSSGQFKILNKSFNGLNYVISAQRL